MDDQRQFDVLHDNLVSMTINDSAGRTTGSPPQIYDLPLEMLWQIMEPLDGAEILSLVRIHPKLLHATKHLKYKRFVGIGSIIAALHDAKQGELEVLLHGAELSRLQFNLDEQQPIDIEGLSVTSLSLQGNDDKSFDKAAIITEKLRPKEIALYCYEKAEMSRRMSRALSNIPQIWIREIGMELIDYIAEWRFATLRCELRKGPIPEHFFDVIKTLLDQYKNGERQRFWLQIRFESPLPDDDLHDNLFGLDYPLQFDGRRSWFTYKWEHVRDLKLHISPHALNIR